ncbi:siderophore-interacting protein [Bifidobacterium sp. ESL0769]|uniref:siderophore-interacting protein n=1 Tax=Bifidobacterium sp. ESL0769 TaxID=2983229 RepID=UPI0023F95C5E|nr:siderophore-interacting protein [Bifidobacterium sp. ESL0769]WEV67322.1 siderophore-interacting protein [Bifidobacterium sp. ESL0769]
MQAQPSEPTQNQPQLEEPTQNQQTTQEPAFQPYLVHVARKKRLSPHFMRIVFTGDELNHFGDDVYDQRIKVMLPMTRTHGPAQPLWADPLLFNHESIARSGWWEQWRALPPDCRNVFRTYTVRAVNQKSREVTVDFVLHNDAGPAGTFAATCRPGDIATLIGPNARSQDSAIGIDFHPGAADSALLIGDETAVPAISSILESLVRDSWRGTTEVFVEVPSVNDFLSLVCPEHTEIHWIARNDAPRGQRLHSALVAEHTTYTTYTTHTATEAENVAPQPAPLPSTSQNRKADDTLPAYCWIAGESSFVRDTRRMLVNNFGVAKDRISFMGYWREGKSEL